MRAIDRLCLPLLRSFFDPETAHGLALKALHLGLGPSGGLPSSPRLRTRLAGLDLPNPIGLAAGFDKNATVLPALSHAGFGFVEVGAATPLPQPGNPKPRLFRLDADRAAINRFGFNNDGAVAIAGRLAARPRGAVIGLNLGANKTSTDRASDFARVLTLAGPHVSFATVNVSSPNTEKLRDLQGRDALDALLGRVMRANAGLVRPVPVFLKIAPDLNDAELAEICAVAEDHGIAALIATNTTLSREGLTDPRKDEAGGLSGQPLFARSTRILARAALLTEGRLPLVGVGGIASAEDAYAKIRAGASAVQFYTAMVFGGIGLAAEFARGLDALLAKDGFANVSEAVGCDAERWASS